MSPRPTGLGKVEIDPVVSKPGENILKAKLYNFDIAGDDIKPVHMDFLKTKVLPLLSHLRGTIWMMGHASRTGTDRFNMALSRRRAENIARVLASQGVHDLQMQTDAFGEIFSTSKFREDEKERCVEIIVLPLPPGKKPPPRKVPKIPPPKPRSKSFYIKQHIELSGGFGKFFNLTYMVFEIYDRDNKRVTSYQFVAPGRGFGLSPPASGTTAGPWNPFRTTVPLAANEFAGPVTWTSLGGLDGSENSLRFDSLVRGAKTEPNPVKMATGFTFGFGYTLLNGKLDLMFKDELNGLWPRTVDPSKEEVAKP